MANAASAVGGAVSGMFGGGGGGRSGAPNFKQPYNQARGDIDALFDPYTDAGKGALGDLQGMLKEGFQPGDLTEDPGYQFQLEQGNRAVSQAGGMQGSPFGGNTLTELSKFNQGLAATTYNNAFNRWQTQVQNLAGMAGLGANAAQAQAGNLTQLFGGLTGAQASTESARIGRGGSFFGAASNLFGL